MNNKIRDALFYIKFLDYLGEKVPGLWYEVDEKTDLYSWSYISQTTYGNEVQEYDIESISEVAKNVTKYLKIVSK